MCLYVCVCVYVFVCVYMRLCGVFFLVLSCCGLPDAYFDLLRTFLSHAYVF